MSRHWIYLRILQIFVDFVGVFVAFVLAYFFRVGPILSTDFPFPPFVAASTLAALSWSGFLILSKYYRVPPRSKIWRDFGLAIIGGIVASATLILVYFFQRELFFSRLINLYATGLGVGFLTASQLIFRKILARWKKNEKMVYRTLVVGANRVAERIIDAINRDPFAPHKIIGVIDPYGLQKSIRGSKILGKLDRLEAVCEREKVSSIIQCDAFEHTLNLISLCDEKNIKFQFEPALRGIFEENLRIRESANIKFVSFVQRDFKGLKKWRFRAIDQILRRIFDVD